MTNDNRQIALTRMATAFNLWLHRYIENPEQFNREFQTVVAFKQESLTDTPTYGDSCAAYLTSLLDELPL